MEERRLWRTRRRPCRLFAEREEKKRERSEKCSVSNPWNEYRLVFVHFTVRSTRHFVPVRFSEHEEGRGWGWFRRRLLSTKIATRYDEFVEGERKGERERERFVFILWWFAHENMDTDRDILKDFLFHYAKYFVYFIFDSPCIRVIFCII